MASAGETKESSTITPIPDEPTFDGLRKKITNVQAEIDKTFGPGNITATVDVSQLIASEAWASMDSKSKVGKPGQQTALRYVSHFPSNVLFLDFSSSFSLFSSILPFFLSLFLSLSSQQDGLCFGDFDQRQQWLVLMGCERYSSC